MRIGVMSDTHGGLKSWREIISGVFFDVDLILHAGDIFYHGIRNPQPEGYDTANLAQAINDLKKPLVACKGNCDSEVDQVVVDIPIQSPYALCHFNGLNILLHHGHVLGDEEVLRLTSHWNYGVSISGHTHVTRLEQKNQVVFLNPGSHSLPKGDGIPTVALIETKGAKAMIDIIDYQQAKSLKNLVMK
jgi:phosphoesterase, MJ0936 family